MGIYFEDLRLIDSNKNFGCGFIFNLFIRRDTSNGPTGQPSLNLLKQCPK